MKTISLLIATTLLSVASLSYGCDSKEGLDAKQKAFDIKCERTSYAQFYKRQHLVEMSESEYYKKDRMLAGLAMRITDNALTEEIQYGMYRLHDVDSNQLTTLINVISSRLNNTKPTESPKMDYADIQKTTYAWRLTPELAKRLNLDVNTTNTISIVTRHSIITPEEPNSVFFYYGLRFN